MEKIKKCWVKLSSIKSNYKEDILTVSEQCWKCTDRETKRLQLLSENRIVKIKETFIISRLAIIAFLILLLIFVYRYIRKGLEKDSITDFLTKAFNRNYFNAMLKHEIDVANRYDLKFSLILLDIDHFKSINDKYGHPAGDDVLRKFAQIVKKELRRTDIFFRVGGEEFAILLFHTGSSDAFIIAERLRDAVERFNFSIPRKVTVSMGVTEYIKGEAELQFVDRADKALYRAKESGRNRVEIV